MLIWKCPSVCYPSCNGCGHVTCHHWAPDVAPHEWCQWDWRVRPRRSATLLERRLLRRSMSLLACSVMLSRRRGPPICCAAVNCCRGMRSPAVTPLSPPCKIGEIGPRMHAKSFVGPQAHSHGPLCMQALQGSTPLVVTPPSRQTRNLARASRETPSPPIALEVGIELLDTRASLPRLPRPLSLCKKKSLRTREREGGRAHHRICPPKSTFGRLGHRTIH